MDGIQNPHPPTSLKQWGRHWCWLSGEDMCHGSDLTTTKASLCGTLKPAAGGRQHLGDPEATAVNWYEDTVHVWRIEGGGCFQ